MQAGHQMTHANATTAGPPAPQVSQVLDNVNSSHPWLAEKSSTAPKHVRERQGYHLVLYLFYCLRGPFTLQRSLRDMKWVI
jgi:hypothetical protein